MDRNQKRQEKKIHKKLAQENPTMDFSFAPNSLLFYGPTIVTDITINASYAESLQSKGLRIPPPVSCRLLIDTGADATIIKHEIAEKAGLKLIATGVPIHGVGVDFDGRSYMGRVNFRCESKKIPTAFHDVYIEAELFSGNLQGDRFDGMLGRDVLNFFDFRYNGKTGKVSMKYLKAP